MKCIQSPRSVTDETGPKVVREVESLLTAGCSSQVSNGVMFRAASLSRPGVDNQARAPDNKSDVVRVQGSDSYKVT